MTLALKSTMQLLADEQLAKDLGPVLDEMRRDYERIAAKGHRYAQTMAAAMASEERFQFNNVETPLILARAAAADMHAIERALRAWVHLRDQIPDGALADHPQAGDMWRTAYAVDITSWAEHPIENAPILKAMHDRLDWLRGLDLKPGAAATSPSR
jgi:hypothetical protein